MCMILEISDKTVVGVNIHRKYRLVYRHSGLNENIQLHFFFFLQVVSSKCILSAFWPSDLISSIVGVFLVTIEFFVPLIILLYCYGRILYMLTKRLNVNIGGNDVPSEKIQLAKTNTIKTFLTVGICFVICWASNQVYYLLYNLGYTLELNGNLYKGTIVMVFLNFIVNPFIYLVKYHDFQKALRTIFVCEKFSHTSQNSRNNISTLGT